MADNEPAPVVKQQESLFNARDEVFRLIKECDSQEDRMRRLAQSYRLQAYEWDFRADNQAKKRAALEQMLTVTKNAVPPIVEKHDV